MPPFGPASASLAVRLARRVSPMQDENVAVRVVEERHEADPRGDRLTEDFDVARFQARSRRLDVRDAERDPAVLGVKGSPRPPAPKRRA